jgi:hypothetical protein
VGDDATVVVRSVHTDASLCQRVTRRSPSVGAGPKHASVYGTSSGCQRVSSEPLSDSFLGGHGSMFQLPVNISSPCSSLLRSAGCMHDLVVDPTEHVDPNSKPSLCVCGVRLPDEY